MYSSLTISCVFIMLSYFSLSIKGWDYCHGEGIKINSVYMKSCSPSASVCQLKEHANQTIYVTFTPLNPFKGLHVIVKATLAPTIKRDFPLDNGNVCEQGARCPLKKGDEEHVHLSVYLMDGIANAYLHTKWQFLDEYNNTQGCFDQIFLVIH